RTQPNGSWPAALTRSSCPPARPDHLPPGNCNPARARLAHDRPAKSLRDAREAVSDLGRGKLREMSTAEAREAVTRAHHEEWAWVVAALTRRFGDLDIAEEAAAEAFATAVERWPADGVPPNPGAWLTTTANRKAIDRIRRENKRDDRQKEARRLHDDDPPGPPGAIDDDRLRLIFTCCHPA